MNIIRNFKDPSSTLMSTKCPLHDLGGPKLTLSKEDFSSSSFSFLAAYFCLGFVSSMKVLTNWNSSTWKKMLYFCHSVLRILVNYRFEKKTTIICSYSSILSLIFFLSLQPAGVGERVPGWLPWRRGGRGARPSAPDGEAQAQGGLMYWNSISISRNLL